MKSYKIITYTIITGLILYSLFITIYVFKQINYQNINNTITNQDNNHIHNLITNLSSEQELYKQELSNLKQSITELSNNNHVNEKISDLATNVDQLKQQIASIITNNDKIAYYQVVSIINTANQSLLLQDIKTSLSLLESTISLINSLPPNLLFTNLKNSIQQDMDDLKTQQNYNSDFVLIKINAFNQIINNIISNRAKPDIPVTNNTDINSIWQKFLNNAKTTLISFWQQQNYHKDYNNFNNLNDNQLLTDKFQLIILNLKHAVITGDENLWHSNIELITSMKTDKVLTDSEYNLLLPELKILDSINISHNYHLTHTIAAINNLANLIFNKNTNV